MFGAGKPFARALKRFARDERGHAAVEFGLVAMPFFMLTFGLAEIAMIGFAQTSMDHAVAEVARSIRTGQAQGSNLSATQVNAELCTQTSAFIALDCTTNLFLDVDSFASFVNVSNASPIRNGDLDTSGFGYCPGAPSTIVVVRAYYRWQVMTPFFQSVFSNLPGGKRLLSSSIMFRNEPFGGGATTCT